MTLKIQRRVTLDISHYGEQATIPFAQNDLVAHEIIFNVVNGTEPVALPPGTMASIAVLNGANGGVVDPLQIDHLNNTLIYIPTANALSVAGNVKATITLFNSYGAVIATPSVIFSINNSETDMTSAAIAAALRASASWGVIVQTAEKAAAAAESADRASFSEGEASASASAAAASATVAAEEVTKAAAEVTKAAAEVEKATAEVEKAAAEADEAAASASNAATKAANSNFYALKSEGYALGTQDGVAVNRFSPYYNENAKYYSSKASTSATAAANSAAEVADARDEIDAQIEDINVVAQNALSIAEGATQAITVTNYSELVTLLSSAAADQFNVGQSILIIQRDVPDIWITGKTGNNNSYSYTSDGQLIADISNSAGELAIGYYTVDFLETEKVDLSEYFKRTEVPTIVRTTLTEANTSGDFDGKSSYIAFSAYPDGSDFTADWQDGQKYVGFATGYSMPTEKAAFEWIYLGSGSLSATIWDGKLILTQQGNQFTATVEDGVLKVR